MKFERDMCKVHKFNSPPCWSEFASDYLSDAAALQWIWIATVICQMSNCDTNSNEAAWFTWSTNNYVQRVSRVTWQPALSYAAFTCRSAWRAVQRLVSLWDRISVNAKRNNAEYPNTVKHDNTWKLPHSDVLQSLAAALSCQGHACRMSSWIESSSASRFQESCVWTLYHC